MSGGEVQFPTCVWCGLEKRDDEIEQSIERVFVRAVEKRKEEVPLLVAYGRLHSIDVSLERLEVHPAVVPCWLGW